jgi:phosphate transport system substrate-binding protein
VGGKVSEGVTGLVRQVPGSIGYVELTYALQNKVAVASVKNKAGKYVPPSTESTTAAIAAFTKELGTDPRIPIVNPPASAEAAYPISTLTFLIVPKDGTDAAKRTALKGFVQYVLGDGQAVAGELNYAPLPEEVKQYDRQTLNQMMVNGKPMM